MANPLDQFTTYVSQNPDSLTGSVARRSTVNPVARRLTDVLDAASTTEPVLNDLVTIVDTAAVDQDVPAVTPTITLAVDSVEALKVSIFTDYIQPFINTQTAVSLLDDLADVAITSPTVGQVLKYTGTNWANGADAGGVGGGSNLLSALTDIQLLLADYLGQHDRCRCLHTLCWQCYEALVVDVSTYRDVDLLGSDRRCFANSLLNFYPKSLLLR